MFIGIYSRSQVSVYRTIGPLVLHVSTSKKYLTGMRISRDCFANFVADFNMTFMRVSHERHENFHVSRTSLELVTKVLNMFKNFMRFFFSKIFRKTVA